MPAIQFYIAVVCMLLVHTCSGKKVEAPGDYLTVFSKRDYSGYNQKLEIAAQGACYNIYDLLNQPVISSSWSLPSYYKITFFENSDCTGNSKTWPGSDKGPADLQRDGFKEGASSVQYSA
ncbi:hypothetical protein K7432_006497 [Basidiobolus ranarum]|uniref:Uncharacterized protein n=1 Tax=Basidiobolus ranarum TaxID=34480 RepID=A0ABR2W1I6_9FUNG